MCMRALVFPMRTEVSGLASAGSKAYIGSQLPRCGWRRGCQANDAKSCMCHKAGAPMAPLVPELELSEPMLAV